MKVNTKLPGLIIISLVLFSSCVNHIAHNGDDPEPCNQTNISLANDIRPILDDNGCASCHSSMFPSGGVDLEEATDIIFEADSGNLLQSIRHEGNVAPMPQSQPQLSPCEIKVIEQWVLEGSKDN